MIVRATIELGRALSLRVVAEGVETRATLDTLTAARLPEAQGFHIARPQPADAFDGKLESRDRRARCLGVERSGATAAESTSLVRRRDAVYHPGSGKRPGERASTTPRAADTILCWRRRRAEPVHSQLHRRGPASSTRSDDLTRAGDELVRIPAVDRVRLVGGRWDGNLSRYFGLSEYPEMVVFGGRYGLEHVDHERGEVTYVFCHDRSTGTA